MWASGTLDCDSKKVRVEKEMLLLRRGKLESNIIIVALFCSTCQRKICECVMQRQSRTLTMVTSVHEAPEMRRLEQARTWKNTEALAEGADSDVSKQPAHKGTSLHSRKS